MRNRKEQTEENRKETQMTNTSSFIEREKAETSDMHIMFGGVSKSAAANMTRLAAVIEATSKSQEIVTVDIEQDLNNLRATYKSDGTTGGE